MITAKDLHWHRRGKYADDLMLGKLCLASVLYDVLARDYEINYNKGINLERFSFTDKELAMQSAVTECILYLNYK